MAPHFPRTLEELRDATEPRLSDHAPITVELPLGDPCPEGACEAGDTPPMEFGDVTWVDAATEL